MDVRPDRDEALSRLFEAHYGDMVRLAFYLTGSWAVAEELAQEAFVRLWRRWGGLRDRHAALGYLRTTVVNLSRSSLRRRLLELRHQWIVGEEAEEADPVGRLDIARALAALPTRKRACVVLRHLVDLSVEETAAVLGISPGSVKSQTHKGLRLLEAALSDGAGVRAQEVHWR
ncbi:MAG TPA: SigE family RNA polymerase sigma factor [Actinomycetes bacterium]